LGSNLTYFQLRVNQLWLWIRCPDAIQGLVSREIFHAALSHP
jgi:hypothetical protein